MTAVLFLLRAIVLVLLWGFVVAAVVAVRRDIFGTRPGRAGRTKAERAPAARKPAAAAKPDKASPRKLVVVQGALAGRTFPLTDAPITIGRADDSTIVLSDDYVSTRHARIAPHNGRWVVEDVGSTNGTYLDRQRVTAPTPVPLGVPIRVGKTVLELRR